MIIIRRLFFAHQNKLQLSFASIGIFIGITFFFLSVNYLIKIISFEEKTESLSKNVIVVQRKIDTESLIGLSQNYFSESQIKNLSNQPFVESLEPIVSNNFNVAFQTYDVNVPYFRSDVFIQTIDSTFLDVKLNKWSWTETDEYVPIILPRDFLVMLNAFMNANGMPQFSEDIAMQVNFKFNLKKNDKKESFYAKIVGFTSEIPAIVVPKSFMQYGKINFSENPPAPITQVMIATKSKHFGKMDEYLKKYGLELKQSQMIISRLKSVFLAFVSVITAISSVAIFLAILVCVQYIQLLIYNNKYNIQTLINIGYDPKKIKKVFFTYFSFLFLLIFLLSIIVFFIMRFFLDSMFKNAGFF